MTISDLYEMVIALYDMFNTSYAHLANKITHNDINNVVMDIIMSENIYSGNNIYINFCKKFVHRISDIIEKPVNGEIIYYEYYNSYKDLEEMADNFNGFDYKVYEMRDSFGYLKQYRVIVNLGLEGKNYVR